jgi:hypothetical protein
MAEKFSVLIKYKYLEYIDNAKLSDSDAWIFMKGIIEYDKSGTDPVFKNPVLTGLFAVIKSDLDGNREKWNGTIKTKSEAGKKGMEKRWGKKEPQGDDEITPVTGDNKNNSSYQEITEITPVTGDNKNITDITKITDLDLDSEFDSEKEKDKDKESVSIFFDENKPPESALPDDKPPGDEPPDDKPVETKEDAVTVWNKARELWNKLGLKPVCRDLMMRGGDIGEILRTFQSYSWAEIKDAIENYAWHKFKAGPDFRPPPPYGSLAGFLKTGVEKYHDSDSLDQQFKEGR